MYKQNMYVMPSNGEFSVVSENDTLTYDTWMNPENTLSETN